MEMLRLYVGKSSIISLKSLATSGYLWSFKNENEEVISVSKENLQQEAELMPGENLPEKFRIEAKKPGNAKLIFIQKRSWETEKAAIATLIFSVTVS